MRESGMVRRGRLPLTVPEVDVVAPGKRARGQYRRHLMSLLVGMYPYRREINTELRLEHRAGLRRQRAAIAPASFESCRQRPVRWQRRGAVDDPRRGLES